MTRFSYVNKVALCHSLTPDAKRGFFKFLKRGFCVCGILAQKKIKRICKCCLIKIGRAIYKLCGEIFLLTGYFLFFSCFFKRLRKQI